MLTEAEIEAHAGRIHDDGYTVIERAASATLVDGLLVRTPAYQGR